MSCLPLTPLVNATRPALPLLSCRARWGGVGRPTRQMLVQQRSTARNAAGTGEREVFSTFGKLKNNFLATPGLKTEEREGSAFCLSRLGPASDQLKTDEREGSAFCPPRLSPRPASDQRLLSPGDIQTPPLVQLGEPASCPHCFVLWERRPSLDRISSKNN